MKIIKTLAIGLAVVAVMSVTSVRASIVATGDPVNIGSWSQAFFENGLYGGVYQTFDMMTAQIISGLPFDVPYGITATGWTSANSAGDTFASITSGTPVGSLNYNYYFSSPAGTYPAFQIDSKIWLGSSQKGEQITTWNGSGWAYAEVPVPEPTTMIAGALLLLPFGASTLRILRRRTA